MADKSMDDVLKKVKEALEKNPSLSVDEAVEITKESARTLPDIGEKTKKIQLARGAIAETSTHIEKIFDEILIVTGNPQMVSSKRFMEKAKFIRTLMETFDPNHKEISEEFLDKLEKTVTIRNLFAHVPLNVFSEEIEFDSSERYHGYFRGDLTLKDVKKGIDIFMGSAQEIMEKTVVFIKRVQIEAQRQKEFFEEIQNILKDLGMDGALGEGDKNE